MAPTLTPRQTFRETVALVAARAKERLPEAVNGRVESAVKLVLVHDVVPQADGTILVGSSTDPLKTYRLQGSTCECQDFTRGQAPEGWCQHRIAAGIHKRVQETLPAAPEPAVAPTETLPPPLRSRPTLRTALRGQERPLRPCQRLQHPLIATSPSPVGRCN